MRDWTTKLSIIKDDHSIKYSIFKDGIQLTRQDIIENWINNQKFREYYNSLLKDAEFEAFYWENPPTNHRQLNEPYEFVIINSLPLRNVNPEPNTFEQYYIDEETVTVFPNLGKDAYLIAPKPLSKLEHYTHLGSFVRYAPKNQIDDFWKIVGINYKKNIENKNTWLSTAGLGVYWLHLRLDSRPKYYKFKPYKTQKNSDIL